MWHRGLTVNLKCYKIMIEFFYWRLTRTSTDQCDLEQSRWAQKKNNWNQHITEELTLYEHKNMLETGLKSFKSHYLNLNLITWIWTTCITLYEFPISQDCSGHILSSVSLQSFCWACRVADVLCWQRLISISTYALVSAEICSLIAGRQMILQVH